MAPLGSPTRDRRAVRRRLRAARRAVDADTRAAAAQALADAIHAIPALLTDAGWAGGVGSHRVTVGGYVPADGEIDPTPALDRLAECGVSIAYPRVTDDGLRFHRCPRADLVVSALGVAEAPARSPAVDLDDLLAVVVPLVAFDDRCNRLGRGGGHYDRTFASMRAPGDGQRITGAGSRLRPGPPWLVGAAFDLQRVDELPVEPHDVALDVIATPTRLVTAPSLTDRTTPPRR